MLMCRIERPLVGSIPESGIELLRSLKVRGDPLKIVGSAPSQGWTLAAESLMIVWEHSGVPRTLKSLIFFDCVSPPLGTIFSAEF